MKITLEKSADDLGPGAPTQNMELDLLALFSQYGDVQISWDPWTEGDIYVTCYISFTPNDKDPESQEPDNMLYEKYDELLKGLGAFGNYSVEA